MKFIVGIVQGRCRSFTDTRTKRPSRCARYMIDQCPENTRSLTVFKQLGWIPVDKLCLLNKLILFKKIIDGRTPDYLCDKLTLFSSSSSKYNTRSRCLYRIPKPKTDALRRTFFYSVISVWNLLGNCMKNCSSISVLKKDFKRWQLEQYSADTFKVSRLY